MQAYNDTADVGHFIHGQRVTGGGSRHQPIFNPATGARARKLLHDAWYRQQPKA